MCCCTTTWAISTARPAPGASRAAAWAPYQRALAGALQAAGGEIRTDAEIERFLVRDGTVEGVALAAARRSAPAPSPRTWTSSAPSSAACDRRDLPDEFLAAVRRFRIRGSSAKINLALDGLPDFPAAPRGAAFLAGDLHASESLLELERAYDDWKDGRWSAEPYFDMLIPSLIDPTMAPPGST